MKFEHTVPFKKKGIRPRKRGFAVIATLTLMMLLTMLAVGVLAIASSQNRIAMNTVLQAEARQQALVGLDAALGALQQELGPDQRVTASSGILSSSDNAGGQHLLGVWDSWDGPIYGTSQSSQKKIQSTYEKGRKSMFRRWMISSQRSKDTRDIEAAENLSSSRPGRRVIMLGEGSLGKKLTARHYVYADLLTMPASGKNKACFAWWVAGENQKAKVSVVDPEETNDVVEILHRTWDTPAPLFSQSRDLDFLPGKIEQPAKILSLPTLPLLASVSQSSGMSYYFDVTTSSFSLPVNVSMGGLKQDLNLLLNKKSLQGTGFEARSNQECPIAENDDIPKGAEHNMPIGSWQNLHAYYNTWPDGTAPGNKNFFARLAGSLSGAYTRMSGSVFDSSLKYYEDADAARGASDQETFFDTRVMQNNSSLSPYSGYARTPVMLAFLSTFGLVTEKSQQSTQDQEKFDLSMCFSPMFLWWNPYNVRMKVRGQQLWSQSIPYKTTYLEDWSTYGDASGQRYVWSRYALWQGTSQFELGMDYGDYFMKTKDSGTADIEFEPGEVLMFTPAKARGREEYGAAMANPWALGYREDTVAGYKARFYSNKANPEQWKIKLRLGIGEVNDGRGRTDGFYFAPQRSEAITVSNGYAGMGSPIGADTSMGKRGMSPTRMLLGWYDPKAYDPSSEKTVVSKLEYWNRDMSPTEKPYYIAAVGVGIKTTDSEMDSYLFSGKDFRSKIWQHSNPAIWTGPIVNPDDQERAYHPYQLIARPYTGPMDCPLGGNGLNNEGSGYIGITEEGEQVSYAAVTELPMHPPFSLAGFAGMRLQPGWFESSGGSGNYKTQGALRRVAYHAGVPGVGIGNSFADPCIPAEDVYCFHENNLVSTGVYDKMYSDFFDHGLLINDALWDRWFCSSISDMPRNNGKILARETLQKFIKGEGDLPVSRYKKNIGSYSEDEVISRIMADDGWKHVAAYLMIDGGFNVNSVSVEAWAAALQGLAKRKLVSNNNPNALSIVERGKSEDQVLFSRFMVSTSEKSIDNLGGYSMMQGSEGLRTEAKPNTSAWGEVRMLEPEQIKRLAEKIVEQVRLRGPFLSMSDFINRRLESGSKEALKGALQAAIDETDINREVDDNVIKNVPSGKLYKHEEAAKGSMYTAAPGYLIQSDVLASLGNILTVRDDTFTVRAYGCVKNAEGAVLSQAWCEAVVQRTMDYVDSSNKPTDSEYEPDGAKSKTKISDLNKVMGRKFRVVSFKWLDAWDI